ncbi:PEP-CTERM sorting domain-containing protein [Caldimonas tepidiphila]|uniref:PEP-CTERM sorting domain-containing protein n=1 Tax=Caldimonas tepidiphila TaxID=2315841 RepID=UPI000E5ADDA2|nr:PEP-CTERM sorting domain-containing protein [Caldimonas tepidiphila]
MSKLRTLGLAAALSFAASATPAQGLKHGSADPVPALAGGMPQADPAPPSPFAGASLFALPQAGSAPALHATSFSALAKHPRYLPFDGLDGAQALSAPAFDETGWTDADLPPTGTALDGSAAGTAVPLRAIPEPNVYALLLAGLAAGAWASRRRKR